MIAVLGISEGFHGGYSLRKRTFSVSMIIPVRSGSIVALVTPMTENNSIDFPKLESLLKWHIAEGLNLLMTAVNSNGIIFSEIKLT